MTLKPAEFDKLKAHVDKTWTSSRCPMCDANDWRVSGTVHLPLQDMAPRSLTQMLMPTNCARMAKTDATREAAQTRREAAEYQRRFVNIRRAAAAEQAEHARKVAITEKVTARCVPLVVQTCLTCGNTVFINMVVAGLCEGVE